MFVQLYVRTVALASRLNGDKTRPIIQRYAAVSLCSSVFSSEEEICVYSKANPLLIGIKKGRAMQQSAVTLHREQFPHTRKSGPNGRSRGCTRDPSEPRRGSCPNHQMTWKPRAHQLCHNFYAIRCSSQRCRTF